MSETVVRRLVAKRILLSVAGLFAFTVLSVVALRIAVREMFMSVEQSRATGLATVPWDTGSTWISHNAPVEFARSDTSGISISRSAQLRARSSSFDRAVESVHQIVAAHRGYLDDLRTESHSGQGRLLLVALAVPPTEFDAALSELKNIGRVTAISELGQDSAVRLASQARHLAAAQGNLARLQKLQRERTAKLLDALALEKEITQANETVAEALRQQEALQATVTQAHISVALEEDYRAPLLATLDGKPLHLRNALVEGIGAIFSTVALMIVVLLEYGLPLLFWLALLLWPARFTWRRPRPFPAAAIS
jgi:Domain of unknown function (DUF4349)